MSTIKTGWVSLDGFVPVLAQWDDRNRWDGGYAPPSILGPSCKVLDSIEPGGWRTQQGDHATLSFGIPGTSDIPVDTASAWMRSGRPLLAE